MKYSVQKSSLTILEPIAIKSTTIFMVMKYYQFHATLPLWKKRQNYLEDKKKKSKMTQFEKKEETFNRRDLEFLWSKKDL